MFCKRFLGSFVIEVARRSDHEIDFELGLLGNSTSVLDIDVHSFTLDEDLLDVRIRHECLQFFIDLHREGCYAYLGQRRLAIGHPKGVRSYGLIEVLEIPAQEAGRRPPAIAIGFLDDSPQGLTVLRSDEGSFLVVDTSPRGGFGQLVWFPLACGW